MTKLWRIAFVILLVCILGSLAWTVLRRPKVPNPVYNGKHLSQWLDEFDARRGEYDWTQNAADAVRQIGTNGVPYLLWEAGSKSSELSESVVTFLNRFLPERFSLPSNNNRRFAAFRAFSLLRDIAVPFATEGLTNTDKKIRLGSELALHNIRPRSPKITRLLIENLDDPDLAVRLQATMTLADVGQDEPEIVLPVLLKLLDQKEKRMQQAAVHALRELGQNAKPAIAKLLEMRSKTNSLSTNDISVIEYAIKEIDPQAAANAGIK